MSQISKPDIRRLKFKNLENKEAFKEWIKTRLKSFYLDKEIPESHLLKFIKYIRKEVLEVHDDSIDRVEWLKKISEIENTLKVLEEYYDENKNLQQK